MLCESIEAARVLKSPHYLDEAACSGCGLSGRRYTLNQRCCFCAQEAAGEFYNDALQRGEPTTLHAALKSGSLTYVTHKACKKAGHVGLVKLDGKCKECSESKQAPGRKGSARSKARANMQTTYAPDTPCSAGHTSRRRVADDLCFECRDLYRAAKTRTELAMRNHPHAVFTRDTAAVLKLIAYRPQAGQPWRYMDDDTEFRG